MQDRSLRRMIDLLPKFEKLTHLTIVNNQQKHYLERFSLHQTFKRCPNLIYFKVHDEKDDLQDPDDFDDSDIPLTNVKVVEKEPTTPHFITGAPAIHYCKHMQQLQTLDLDITRVPIARLARFIPPQLSTLRLKMRWDSFDSWIYSCDKKVLEIFCRETTWN
jgi:hypothetical protein